MVVLVNGKFEPTVSVGDRGLHYGDGLFETLAVVEGKPCLWARHMKRLLRGCNRLGIPEPNPEQLIEEGLKAIARSSRGVLKLIITRGAGGRGYLPPANVEATRIIQFSAWPEYPSDLLSQGVRVRLCETRLGATPSLAGLKTLNRLEQVLARSEWDSPEFLEGVVRDTAGRVIEGTMSNLFLVAGGGLRTPDLSRCGIAGVMRELIMEIGESLGISTTQEDLTLDDIRQADGMFLSNSLIGIWPVREFMGVAYNPAVVPSPLVTAVMDRGFRFD